MSNAITQRQNGAANVIEQVIIEGDLARLTPEQRVDYYARVCESVGLNPYTKPFDYIRLNNRLVLYALKGATDQLRKLHGVSARIVSQERIDDVLVVTVEATDKTGRVDTEIGAVSIGNLKGDALANAMMKALTKAKRRVTLSICGLGMLDETEVESIPDAQHTDHLREVPSATTSNARQIRDSAPRQRKDDGYGPATQRQVNYLHAVANEIGMSQEALHDRSMETFGCGVGELSRRDISMLIEQIQEEHAEKLPGSGQSVEVIDGDTGEIIDAPMQVNDPSAGHPATERQIKAIFGIGRSKGLTNDQITEEIYGRFGVQSRKDLTVGQASELIDAFNAIDADSDMQPALGM